MTPKEKAEELVNKYMNIGQVKMSDYSRIYLPTAKVCALIAVDEIINSEPRTPSDIDWDEVGGTHQYYYEAQREEALKYWMEVKKEIGNI